MCRCSGASERLPHFRHSKWMYPLVICYIAIEHGPVEIVDLPSYKMVDLSIVFSMFTRG